MCGIIGYVGRRDATPVLMQGLRRLEYRGYDSAGVALLSDGKIEIRRCAGKLDALDRLLQEQPVHGNVGIGHTRWATHGRPSEGNAHPHKAGGVVLIHNGIIENYLSLRASLAAEGRKIRSETDTEIISHLIDAFMEDGAGFEDAVRAAVRKLEGSFAIVAMCEREPGRLFVAKSATPIVVGFGDGEQFVASDIPALLEYTRDVLFLEDGEIADITAEDVRISRFDGSPVTRLPRRITWDPVTAQKGGFKHFLAKEIHEQGQAIIDTMRGRLLLSEGDVDLSEIALGEDWCRNLERVDLVGCGTAWHACLVAKFFFEQLAQVPCTVDYGSEFRYRRPVLRSSGLVLAVSQSGETADTLAAVEEAREQSCPSLAVCNVVDSSLARRADAVVYTHAGPEISVASTKAFTTQLVVLLLLAVHVGRRRGVLDRDAGRKLVTALMGVAPQIAGVLDREREIEDIARRYAGARDVLYLGRGMNYPIALEGALKLKEISYIHAEGYPAGEMKHGPIALISEEVPVLVLLPDDAAFPKTLSNLKEAESRGGQIITVTDRADEDVRTVSREVIRVPSVDPFLMPLVLTIPLQLLAYHVAVHRGTDVDQPRNLAKSVTVE